MDDAVHGWGCHHTPDDHDGDDHDGDGSGDDDYGGGEYGGDGVDHVWDVAIHLFRIFNCAVHAHMEAPFQKQLTF